MPCTALPPLPDPVAAERIEALAQELQRQDPSLTLLRDTADRVRYSRDCHDYSPVLTPLLAGRIAQLVVRVQSVEQVMAVAGACARHGVPLTARGAGTGNYGQCVPLCGGVVIDLMGLNRLRQLDPASGVMVAEAGCILA
ncbi:MAG: FAD-binding oxidoreductase, partial [Cyanobacteriota bacterium]